MTPDYHDPALGPPPIATVGGPPPKPPRPNPFNLKALREGVKAIDENVANLTAAVVREQQRKQEFIDHAAALEKWYAAIEEWEQSVAEWEKQNE